MPRSLRRKAARRRARPGRSAPDDRRSRQRGADDRPGIGRTANCPHDEPGAADRRDERRSEAPGRRRRAQGRRSDDPWIDGNQDSDGDDGTGPPAKRAMTHIRVAIPPEEPWMLFDGECSFCRYWVTRWKAILRDKAVFLPFQEAGERFPEIPVEAFRSAVHLIEPSGEVTRGAEAVFRARSLGGKHWALACYRNLPGFAPATALAYRLLPDTRNAADLV